MYILILQSSEDDCKNVNLRNMIIDRGKAKVDNHIRKGHILYY